MLASQPQRPQVVRLECFAMKTPGPQRGHASFLRTNLPLSTVYKLERFDIIPHPRKHLPQFQQVAQHRQLVLQQVLMILQQLLLRAFQECT